MSIVRRLRAALEGCTVNEALNAMVHVLASAAHVTGNTDLVLTALVRELEQPCEACAPLIKPRTATPGLVH